MFGTVAGATVRTVSGMAPVRVAVAAAVAAAVAVVVAVTVLVVTTVTHAGATEPDCVETAGDMTTEVGTVGRDTVATV